MYKTTTCTTLQIQKAIELRETTERRRSDKIKRPRRQRGLLSCFRRDFSAQTERNPLAGGAQIVGRRLARTAICYDLVADLLAFTQRSKSGALDGADVHEHV